MKTNLNEGDLVLCDVVDQFNYLGIIRPVSRIEGNANTLGKIRRKKAIVKALEKCELATRFAQSTELRNM